MAKIENTTAYPTVTPAASDLLIGTDVNDNNKTVTFLVSDIVGAVAISQDLQSVLTVGGDATLPITLTGDTGNIICTDIHPKTLTAQGNTGNAGQLLSSTGSGLLWVDSPTVSAPTLQQVVDEGNMSTTDITVRSATLTVNNAGGILAVDSPALMDVSGVAQFSNTNVNLIASTLSFDSTSKINDGTGSDGTAGQLLSVNSTATGVEWSSSIPTAAMPTLQEVLTANSTAASVGMTFSGTSVVTLGANNSMVTSGTNSHSGNNNFTAVGTTTSTSAIHLPGTLNDGTSVGTSGQVLTSTGTGVQWMTSAASPDTLQQVLDTGNTATGANASIFITGTLDAATITDGASSTGSAGQVLSSTGSGLAWTTAGTGAVSQVTAASESASTGSALTITPITGSVVVTPHTFNGAANIGVVPSSAAASQTTTFLRADGSWQTPAANEPHGMQSWRFGSTNKSFTSGNYYTMTRYDQYDSFNDYDLANDLGSVSPTAIGGTMTDANHMSGILMTNGGEGVNCSTGFSDIPICNAQVQIISSVAGTYGVVLYKTQLCTKGTYTVAASASVVVGSADTFTCGTLTFVSTALRTLEDGYSYYLTVSPQFTSTGVNFQSNMVLRW